MSSERAVTWMRRWGLWLWLGVGQGRRRPPFSVVLVVVVVGLTAATGGTIGLLAWRQQRAASQALMQAAVVQAATLAAEHSRRFLLEAESAARLGPQLVARGLLDVENDRAIAQYALAVLRAHPRFTWVSYGDQADRFVGAWRDTNGSVYVNRSYPAEGLIHLEEDQVLPDGSWRPVRRSGDHGYRPRERPYFQQAVARRDVTWTEPYPFYKGGGLGITAAAPLLDATGQVLGVFTVDFTLDALSAFLADLQVSEHGRALIASPDGRLLVSPFGNTPDASNDEALAWALGRGLEPDGHPASLSERIREVVAGEAGGGGRPLAPEIEVAGERYLGHATPLAVGDHRWVVAVVVPRQDYMAAIDAQARRTGVLALAALVLAVAGGVSLSRWIARPLRELGAQARRISRGDLGVRLVTRSRDEIGTLARAMAEMVQGLRDRDFIRDTLGRYVSPELAARCLRDRDAVRLGGELRDVTILMSDLRDFSELSERLGPQAMLQLLNRYLAHMARVILRYGGTIDEFLGDGILVLFGAPFGRPDDPERAVRCAWAMQQAMHAFNDENRALGLPPVHMGIGVHTGPVVAGNIGSAEHVKYGVVGPAVNLTARIEGLTAGPRILISEATLGRARAVALVGAPRQVVVKGPSAPITVYELVGVVEAGSPEDPTPAPLSSPHPTRPRPRRVRRRPHPSPGSVPGPLLDHAAAGSPGATGGSGAPGPGSQPAPVPRGHAAGQVRDSAVDTPARPC